MWLCLSESGSRAAGLGRALHGRRGAKLAESVGAAGGGRRAVRSSLKAWVPLILARASLDGLCVTRVLGLFPCGLHFGTKRRAWMTQLPMTEDTQRQWLEQDFFLFLSAGRHDSPPHQGPGPFLPLCCRARPSASQARIQHQVSQPRSEHGGGSEGAGSACVHPRSPKGPPGLSQDFPYTHVSVPAHRGAA